VIPDAAVEAAWRESLRNDVTRADLKKILEAAAPHMLAGAWQVGFSTGRDFEDFYFKSAEPPNPLPEQPPNPYRTAK